MGYHVVICCSVACTARSGAALVAVGDKVYLFGGQVSWALSHMCLCILSAGQALTPATASPLTAVAWELDGYEPCIQQKLHSTSFLRLLTMYYML